MIYILLTLTVVFVVVVFYLAKVVVLQLEQRADEEVIRSKETFDKIIGQKDKAFAEKSRLERESTQIFTLYEMTKEISRHFSEQEALQVFRRRLKENITIDDCQLMHDLSDNPNIPEDHSIFVLKSKEKKLGVLVYKGVPEKDKEKFVILAHQFALALRRIKLYQDIETLAITDSLTNVYTRRYFMERFDEEIKRCALRKTKLSFLMIDADHFKAVNDQYGHLTGDQVLREIGQIIKESVREIDIVGRFGGEEFCVVLPDSDLEGSRVVAERIRKAAEQKLIKAYDNSLHITLSIGIGVYPTDGKSMEELMDKSDWALYRAKSQGRNCVVAFSLYHKP